MRFSIHVPASLRVAVVLAGLFSAACGSDSTAPGTHAGSLASIAVSPNVTLAIKASQQFVAVGKDAAGVAVAISPVWSVASGGGTISAAGLFTAGTIPGTYTSTVMATSGKVSGSASVIVINGVVASVARP